MDKAYFGWMRLSGHFFYELARIVEGTFWVVGGVVGNFLFFRGIFWVDVGMGGGVFWVDQVWVDIFCG